MAVSENTVADLMAEQHLVARPKRRRRGTTRPGKGRWRAPDLVGRDFSAGRLNQRWFGDGTEILTGEGKLYLASVLDICSRRIVGFSLSEHHDAELAYAALAMAVAVRGGDVAGVLLHTDGGGEYTAGSFRAACQRLAVVQSMGRPGSALDNAAIEAFHSTLTFELLDLETFDTRARPSAPRRVGRGVQPRPAALRSRDAQPPHLRARASGRGRRSRRGQRAAVLAGVKAKPCGRPTASLDTGCGRRR